MSHIMLTGYPIQKDLLLSTVLQLTAVTVTFLRWSYAPCPLKHDLPMKTANHKYAGIRSSCPPITTTNTWDSAGCIKVIKWFYYSSGSQLQMTVFPTGHRQCMVVCLSVMTRGRYAEARSTAEHTQCTGQPLQQRDPQPSVHSAEAETRVYSMTQQSYS